MPQPNPHDKQIDDMANGTFRGVDPVKSEKKKVEGDVWTLYKPATKDRPKIEINQRGELRAGM